MYSSFSVWSAIWDTVGPSSISQAACCLFTLFFQNAVILVVLQLLSCSQCAACLSSVTVLHSPNFPVDHRTGEKFMLEKTCRGHLVSSLVLSRASFEVILGWLLRAFLILHFVFISKDGDSPDLRDPVPMLTYLPVVAPFPLSLIPSENFHYYKLWPSPPHYCAALE